MDKFQNWINGNTDGAGCKPQITMINSNDVSLVPASRSKVPHLTEWRRRLATVRASPSTSYSPFAVNSVNVTGAKQSSNSKGSTFTSLVRALDQSIAADKPKPFSLYGLVKSLLRFITRLADSALHMETRNVVCVLAVVHTLRSLLRPHQHRIINKLKLLSYAIALRIASVISSRLHDSATALAVYSRIIAT